MGWSAPSSCLALRHSTTEGLQRYGTSLEVRLGTESNWLKPFSTSSAPMNAGAIVQRANSRRHSPLTFFERAEPALVGMEACPGSQRLVRKL
jgi:hypothetical protein